MPKPTLVIGDKNYSSWSLRPWMALSMAGISFKEKLVPLYSDTFDKTVKKVSGAGKVPILLHKDRTIWDSLAIVEYAAETWPKKRVWPSNKDARAMARSASAEMHSGFSALRSECGMNLHREPHLPKAGLSEAAKADVVRIEALWAHCRKLHGKGGPFLFGKFCAADAMFAPVVTRLHNYAIPVASKTRAYMKAVMETKAFKDWQTAALAETNRIEKYETV